MKVKICGMTRPQDARLAWELGAWAVGLVFAPSPRRLSLEAGRSLRRSLPPGLLAVGVFRDAPRPEILAAIRECALDAVQLHGSEAPADCRGFPVPVWKAFELKSQRPPVEDYAVAALLLEPARADRERGAPDPRDQRAAWETAAALKGSGPLIILAGGLNPENVAEAVRIAGPDAVDVSSGVESSPGVKDAVKLKAFFQALSP